MTMHEPRARLDPAPPAAGDHHPGAAAGGAGVASSRAWRARGCDIANVHDRLLQSARTVAAGDQNLLAAAEQVLRAVGSLSEVRGMNGNCDGVLADTLIGVRYFSNLSRIDADGPRRLLGHGAGPWPESQQLCGFSQDAQKTDGMAVSNELVSRVTGQPVIGGMLALHKPDGSFDGTRGDRAGRALDRLHDARRPTCPRARWWRSMTAPAR